MAIGIWSVCSARNLKLWEQKQVTRELAVQWSSRMVAQDRIQQRSIDEIRSQAHTVSRVKLNVDASVVTGTSMFSIGMVIRDHKGEFYCARTFRLIGEISAFEAEARGVLQALKWTQELQLSNIDIESDSFLTITAVTRGAENHLEVVNIIQKCSLILSNCPNVTISHAEGSANKVNHLLAREPCMVNSSKVFWSLPSSFLETMMYDLAL